jgi:hypothetical protein
MHTVREEFQIFLQAILDVLVPYVEKAEEAQNRKLLALVVETINALTASASNNIKLLSSMKQKW